MGTVYENAVGTAQALAQLKANIDEPFIRFGERMRGAKPADLNVIPKALGKAKEWSPLQYEKGTVTYDPEWGQVTKKPITEAFEKFKQGPSLKDVTGDITKAPQWLAQGVGKMGPQFAAAGAATALTGPFGGILMNAVNNIGERYNTALKEKVNAPAAGIFTGLLISAFDTLGPWLQLRGVTKGLLSTAGVGGGTELVQEIMAILHEKFLGIPVKDPFWRLMENFLLGMFIEGGTHAAARPSKAAAQPQVSTGPPPPPPGGPPPPPPGAPPAAPPTTPAPHFGEPGYAEWAAQNGFTLDDKGRIDLTVEQRAPAPAAPAPAAQPSVEIQPPQPAAPASPVDAESERISQSLFGRPYADLDPETARLVRLDAIENLAPTTTVPPDADMVVEGPNGPQAVDSADVFVDRILQAAGIEEPKPTAWEARVAAAKERQAKSGGALYSNPFANPQWVSDMVVIIADDIRHGVVTAKKAIERLVAKYGEQYRPQALDVVRQAQVLSKEPPAPGMPAAAPQTAPGASAATPPSLTATPPTGSPQGQPAQIPVPPVEPPLPPNPADWPDPDPSGPLRNLLRLPLKAFRWSKEVGLQLYQMAQQYPDFPPIQNQIKAQARWDAHEHQWVSYNGQVYQAVVGLGKKRLKQLSDLTFDVRLREIKANARLTDEAVARIADGYGIKDTDKTFQVYQQMQRYFLDSWEAMRQAQIQYLQATVPDPVELAKAIKTTNEQFAEQAKFHYVPLMRFGEFMVSAYIPTTDPKYKSGTRIDQQAHFASHAAALEAAAEMRKQYREDGQVVDNIYVSPKPMSPAMQNLASLPPDMASRLVDKLGLTPDQRAELSRMVGDRITDNSYFQRLKNAKGIAGYSTDLPRALAAYGASHSKQIADTLERHHLEQAVKDAAEEIRNRGRGSGGITDVTEMMGVLEVMKDANISILNPKVRGYSAAGAMAAWHFGLSPKQALINLTQSMMTPAILSQQEITTTVDTPAGRKTVTKEVGYARAHWETAKAMAQVLDFYTRRNYHKVKGKVTGAPDQYVYDGLMSQRAVEAMQKATDAGVIPDTQAKNVASHSHGNLMEWMLGEAMGLKGEKIGRSIGEFSTWLPQQTLKLMSGSEVWNRQVAFVASFNALEKAGHPDPYQGAVKVVKLSQGYNATSNKSWLQRTFPNNMLFKSYTQNNVYLQTMSKYAFRLWVAQWVLSGIEGGLGLEHIFKFLDSLGSWFKKRAGYKNPHVDIKHDIREWLTAQIGQIPTELLMRGVSGGNPWVDVGGSTGQGRVLPLVDIFFDLTHGVTDYKTAVERGVQDIGGVALGTGMNFMKSLVDESPDSYRFWKGVLPKLAGQFAEAGSAYEEGGVKDAAGNMLMRLDTTNPNDLAKIFGIAFGVPPAELTAAKRSAWVAREHLIYFTHLRDNIQKDYNRALDSQDQDKIRKVHEDIEEFNRKILPEGIHYYLPYFHRNYMSRGRKQNKVEQDPSNAFPQQWRNEMQNRGAPYAPQ
jgi:hypothetical protein